MGGSISPPARSSCTSTCSTRAPPNPCAQAAARRPTVRIQPRHANCANLVGRFLLPITSKHLRAPTCAPCVPYCPALWHTESGRKCAHLHAALTFTYAWGVPSRGGDRVLVAGPVREINLRALPPCFTYPQPLPSRACQQKRASRVAVRLQKQQENNDLFNCRRFPDVGGGLRSRPIRL